MIDFAATFIFFFAVIDPIGTVPVFIAVTSGFDREAKKKIAIQATLVSAGVLIFFVIAGEIILTAIDIPLPAFQVAGGIILFLFAITMIFGESKPEEELKMAAYSRRRLPPNPRQSCHPFHGKVATHSRAKLPPLTG